MQSALERRQELFEVMCERRHDTIDNLAFQFGVDRRTIERDIELLSLKTYIQLCLAICYQALTQNAASYRKTQTTNDKYTFRTWLLRLGMIGDEFETARKWLLENLSGDTAFRYGRTRAAA